MAKLKKTLTCAKCGKAFAPTVDKLVGFSTIRCVADGREVLFDFGGDMWLCTTCSKLMREAFLGYEVEK